MTTLTAEPMTQLEDLPEYVAGVLDRWGVPGMSVAVTRGGKVIYSEAFGYRDREGKLPATTKTLFAIGSSTKAFTTMALATLVDEGKLDWDTPIRTYLPWFQMHDPFTTDRMTARDLVTHRSGLPRYDMLWYNNTKSSREDLVRRLRFLPPSADFRTVFQYQNLMYLTAGFLVEELDGRTWEEAVRARILDPLGMSSANFSVEDSRTTDDYALPYSEIKGEVKQVPFRNIDLIGPAGSINANLEDMTKWLLLHQSAGTVDGNRLVSQAQMDEMHKTQMFMAGPYMNLEQNAHGTYGMGWFIESYNGDTLIHHGGAIDGFLGLVAFMPKHDIGVVVQTNLGGISTPFIVTYEILDRMRGREPSPVEAHIRKLYDEGRAAMAKGKERSVSDKAEGTRASHKLESYTGTFSHPGMGEITVGLDGGSLTYTFNDETYPLTHYHYDVFEFFERLHGIRFGVNFRSNMRGEIDSLHIALEPSMPAMEFKRLADQSMKNRAFLERFAGEYELMGATVTVTLENESALVMALPQQAKRELVPHHGTTFNLKGMDGYVLEFKTNEGAVTGIDIVAPTGVFTAKRISE